MTAVSPLSGRPTQTAPTPYGAGSYRLVRCLETGFVYLANPPEYHEVRDAFPWEQTQQEERQRRAGAEPVVARLSALAKRAKQLFRPRRNPIYNLAAAAVSKSPSDRTLRLLDIGCGCGGLAVDCCTRFAAAGRDVTPIGIELSERLAQAAGDRFSEWCGHVIAQPALEGLGRVEDESLDLAILASFIEHDSRPLELLESLRPKLAPGGAVIIKAPNFASLNRYVRGKRWCGFRFPDHVNYFTPDTLRLLARNAGYQTDRGSWRDRQPLSDNMYAVLRAAA